MTRSVCGYEGFLMYGGDIFPCYNIIVEENIDYNHVRDLTGMIISTISRGVEKRVFFRSNIDISKIFDPHAILYFKAPFERISHRCDIDIIRVNSNMKFEAIVKNEIMEDPTPSKNFYEKKMIKDKNLIDILKEDIDILKEIDNNMHDIDDVELELRKITKNEKKIF